MSTITCVSIAGSGEDAQGTLSVFGCVVNLVKLAIGLCVFSLPTAAYGLGWVGCPVGFGLVAILCVVSTDCFTDVMEKLENVYPRNSIAHENSASLDGTRASDTVSPSMAERQALLGEDVKIVVVEDVYYHAFGKVAFGIVCFLQNFAMGGSVCIALIILGRSLNTLVPALSVAAWLWIYCVVLLPLCWITEMNKLAKVSIIGLIGTAVFMIGVIIASFLAFSDHHEYIENLIDDKSSSQNPLVRQNLKIISICF